MCTVKEAKDANLEALHEVIPQLVSSIVREIGLHHTPSPDTLRKFEMIDARLDKNDSDHDKLIHAIENLDTTLKESAPILKTWGEIVTTGKWGTFIFKGLVALVGGTGIIFAGILAFKEWLKH